jgi:DNA-binding transcriptional regulator YhcF (GntR family)
VLGVNRNTVLRALRHLREEAAVARRHGCERHEVVELLQTLP